MVEASPNANRLSLKLSGMKERRVSIRADSSRKNKVSSLHMPRKSSTGTGTDEVAHNSGTPRYLLRKNMTYRRFKTKTTRDIYKKRRLKPKVTPAMLKAVIYHVFSEADDDANGDLDLKECRDFVKTLFHKTYPDAKWDEEKFKRGFYSIDKDKGGSIDFEEMYKKI